MKYKVFSVKDELVGFNPAFFVQDNGRADMIATRSVKEAFDRGAFGETAIDCSLYCLGTWDDHTGAFENYQFPEIVKRVQDFILERKYENEVSDSV